MGHGLLPSPYLKSYFGLVEEAKSVILGGERLRLNDSIRAKIDGFPQPDPCEGQVWFVMSVDGYLPICFGDIGAGNGPGIWCRIGPHFFLILDKKVTDEGYFTYSPTIAEYNEWLKNNAHTERN